MPTAYAAVNRDFACQIMRENRKIGTQILELPQPRPRGETLANAAANGPFTERLKLQDS